MCITLPSMRPLLAADALSFCSSASLACGPLPGLADIIGQVHLQLGLAGIIDRQRESPVADRVGGQERAGGVEAWTRGTT
jgi:hypothetical protein